MASITDLIQIYNSGLYASAYRSTYIDVAKGLTSQTFYGSNYNLAVCLLSCHIYTLNTRPGSGIGVAGGVTSMREGDLSLGIGSITAKNLTDSYYAQTTYGLQLQALKRSTLPGASVTGICSVSQFEV